MATTWHGLTADGLIALSDVDLVCLAHDWIDRVDNDIASDALYFLLGEIVERFAGEDVAREEVKRHYLDDSDDLDDDLTNYAAALEAMKRRQAARLIRDTFDRDEAS